eukprot:1159381-Pelagomonas_calceolata.AAC.12
MAEVSWLAKGRIPHRDWGADLKGDKGSLPGPTSAGCAKLYVRAHADQMRSAAAVVTCAESNFGDA